VCRGSVYAQSVRRGRGAAAPAPAPGDGRLQGEACSPGRVRGLARVLKAPGSDDKIEDEILVAPTTEPGWMFLLLAAKGLIVERGSLLSHAAIIGRELGIPTIVGADHATEWIASGDEVEMDGGTGEIRLLRRAV
jgi:phosphohistidine swiveling domain-containing protein